MTNPIIILKENLSDFHELVPYPDGQKSVILQTDRLDVKKPVNIRCRIKNPDELFVLMCLITALRNNDFYIHEVQFVYLFGMRSDRKFFNTDVNYFRDIVAPTINKMKIPCVKAFAPHNLIVLEYIKSYFDICELDMDSSNFDWYASETWLMWGDANANLLRSSLPSLQKGRRIANFIKDRVDGKIGISMHHNDICGLNRLRKIVILDDLCDGGATFIAEAAFLRENGFNGKLELFIAHGLFTKGIDALFPHFDHIYCTNSYQDIEHPSVTQFKVI